MSLRHDDHLDIIRELAKGESAGRMDPHWSFSRRGFLKSSVASGAALAMPFSALSGKAHAVALPYSPDYGPLAPVADEVTGLPLLQLPAGFKYWSFGWTGDTMSDGRPTPGSHDGMAVVASDANKIVLVRNHEQGGTSGAFASPKVTYDPACNGGTTNLVFAPRLQQWVGAYASISGTIRNCAGGPTPWNSWISCEETTNGLHSGSAYTKQHGYCFDVPAVGAARPVPLTDMGCFSHEAVAVNPATGIIYETEDSTPSGFYRFIPNMPGNPAAGGRLQMMRLAAAHNASITLLGTSYGYFNTGAAGMVAGMSWDVELGGHRRAQQTLRFRHQLRWRARPGPDPGRLEHRARRRLLVRQRRDLCVLDQRRQRPPGPDLRLRSAPRDLYAGVRIERCERGQQP